MDDSICSRDLPRSGFAPHGEFRMRYADGILHSHNIGPFNAEALRLYAQLRSTAFQRWQLSGQWIGGLASWEGSALMPPEAFEDYERGLAEFLRTEHRLAAVAWVSDAELEGMRFMVGRFGRLFEAAGMPFRLFTEQPAARSWLQPFIEARRRAA